MILAGDVGGTKVHLALYNFEGGRLKPVRDQKYPAHEFASLDAVVEKFLGGGMASSGSRLLRRASAVRGRCAMGG
jgi:glucokinase